MIHSANEFAAKHRRFLLSGTAVGFKALDTGGNLPEDGEIITPQQMLLGRCGTV